MLRRSVSIVVSFLIIFFLSISTSSAADLDFLIIETGITSATVPFDTSIKQKLNITNTSDQVREITFSTFLQESGEEISSLPQSKMLRFAPGQTLNVQTFLDERSAGWDFSSPGGQQRNVEWRFEDRATGESRTEIITHSLVVEDTEVITGELQVTGTVIDHHGNPVNRADVILSTGGWSTQTYTASDGTFSFPGVPVRDDWFIRVTANRSDISSYHSTVSRGLRLINDVWAHDIPVNVDSTGFVFVEPSIDSYVIEVMPMTHTASFSRTANIPLTIGPWSRKGMVDDLERYILLINGMEIIADDDKNSARLELYTLDGALQWVYDTGYEAWGAELSRDGMYVAFMTSNPTQTFGVLDVANGEPLWINQKDAYELASLESNNVRISYTNTYLAIGDEGGEVILVDLMTGTLVWRTGVLGYAEELVFSQDDTYLYISTNDGWVYKLKTSDGLVVWSEMIGSQSNELMLSSDNAYLGVASGTGEVAIIDTEAGSHVWATDIHGVAYWIDFSPDGEYVFVGGTGQYANTLYETVSGRRIWRFDDISYSGQFATDGRYMLMNGDDTKLVDLYGNVITSFPADNREGFSYLSKDGGRLIYTRLDPESGSMSVVFARGEVSPLSDMYYSDGETRDEDATILFVLLGIMGVVTFAGIVSFTMRKKSVPAQSVTSTKKASNKTNRAEVKRSSKWLENKDKKPVTKTVRKASPRKKKESE